MAEAPPPAEEKSEEQAPESPKMNRREFLNYAWLASLGVLLVNVGGIGYLFSMPRFREGEFGSVLG